LTFTKQFSYLQFAHDLYLLSGSDQQITAEKEQLTGLKEAEKKTGVRISLYRRQIVEGFKTENRINMQK